MLYIGFKIMIHNNEAKRDDCTLVMTSLCDFMSTWLTGVRRRKRTRCALVMTFLMTYIQSEATMRYQLIPHGSLILKVRLPCGISWYYTLGLIKASVPYQLIPQTSYEHVNTSGLRPSLYTLTNSPYHRDFHNCPPTFTRPAASLYLIKQHTRRRPTALLYTTIHPRFLGLRPLYIPVVTCIYLANVLP